MVIWNTNEPDLAFSLTEIGWMFSEIHYLPRQSCKVSKKLLNFPSVLPLIVRVRFSSQKHIITNASRQYSIRTQSIIVKTEQVNGPKKNSSRISFSFQLLLTVSQEPMITSRVSFTRAYGMSSLCIIAMYVAYHG